MLNLLDSVRGQCSDLPTEILEMHFRRLSTSYFERYSATDIARHLRLIAGFHGRHSLDVEVHPLAGSTFEVLVIAADHPGCVACITAALAAYGFDLEDVQVSTYLDGGTGGEEPGFGIIRLRVSGALPGRSLPAFVEELRARLRQAFVPLAHGNLLEAQTIASDTRSPVPSDASGSRFRSRDNRAANYEGMLLGGDFSMQRKLAQGGMSEVYLATQLSLNRTVAVKLFHHEGTADDEEMARFNREAVVLAQFSSPHIVQILAAGSTQERSGGLLAWMAMEYLAGGDCGHQLRDHGPIPSVLATRWLRQALEGLAYAHRQGILHRDLKPHNLLLTAEGHLKVSDFGLLKESQRPLGNRTPRSAVLGTPQYMSPEQALGEPLDERSDIFSLGSTFFHLVSGRLPFLKSNATAMLLEIAQSDAPRLSEVATQAPLPLSVILHRMMARRKEERYQDVGVILEDLASYERRGLLEMSDSGFVALQGAAVSPGEETQAYEPARADLV